MEFFYFAGCGNGAGTLPRGDATGRYRLMAPQTPGLRDRGDGSVTGLGRRAHIPPSHALESRSSAVKMRRRRQRRRGAEGWARIGPEHGLFKLGCFIC